MSKKSIILMLCLILLISLPIGAVKKYKILTIHNVLGYMETSLNKIEDYSANFTLLNDKYKANGILYYKKPYYFRMNSGSDGSEIVTNGEKLWIHLPYYGLVAEQELVKSKRQLMFFSSRKKLYLLKRDYYFKFASGGRKNPKFYILDLTPKVTKIGFKWIKMWVDKKNGLIMRINSKTINNKDVNISFSNIKLNKGLSKSHFWFGMPDKNIQVIKNTILPVDIFKRRR
ncbi:MAG: outer membrane lipoprotein carrier protein LolA [Spirochaetes bacterium]|nr:outer membrane lipoprotein carrier protein LolA [Spirochaetota bacterium]